MWVVVGRKREVKGIVGRLCWLEQRRRCAPHLHTFSSPFAHPLQCASAGWPCRLQQCGHSAPHLHGPAARAV